MPTPQEKLDLECLQAVCDRDAQKVSDALSAGANPMATSPNNAWDAMNHAIFCGATEVIAALALGGYPLSGATPQRPETPLNFAMSMPTHMPAVIKELIKQGVNINGVDGDGHDALCIALKRIDKRGITLLMEMGADPARAQKMLDEGRGGRQVKDHFALQALLQLKRTGVACGAAVEQGTAIAVSPLKPLKFKPADVRRPLRLRSPS